MKIHVSAFAAALSFAAIPTLSSAETLKGSTFVPPNNAFNKMLTSWGEELSQKTDGELTLEIFPSGQLGPPPRQFDLVASGATDILLVLHAATPGGFPIAELVVMPFTTPSVDEESAKTSRRLTEIAPEFLADVHEGMKILTTDSSLSHAECQKLSSDAAQMPTRWVCGQGITSANGNPTKSYWSE